MSSSSTGQIVNWQKHRGYGFVESKGRRIFLHIRDFAAYHKDPEVGDQITFDLGVDAQGRPCAQHALHVGARGRQFGLRTLFLLLLIVAPTLALLRFSATVDFRILAGYFAVISLFTAALYWDDKRRARLAQRRIPESTLHVLELAGGWPAAFLAQRWLRHKNSKLSYQIVFWLIVALHEGVAGDYLLGGRLLHYLGQTLGAWWK